MTRISVCLASFNGQHFIRLQIDSILNQLGPEDEIVISDDSSEDSTIDIIDSFRDNRIRIFPKQKFRNPIFNFENALNHAKGKYIFLADQDDVWLPGRIKEVLNCFNNYDMVICDCKIVDEQLKILKESYFSLVDAKPGMWRNLFRTSPYIGCCMAFKRNVLEMALPFPSNIPMHDFWIAMIAEARFKVKFLHEPLILYRRHSMAASFTAGTSKNSLYRKISFRVNTILSLLPRILRESSKHD